jgi:hypothetical protein
MQNFSSLASETDSAKFLIIFPDFFLNLQQIPKRISKNFKPEYAFYIFRLKRQGL